MKRYLPTIFLLVLAAILIIGFVQLFELRFSAGDVYPVYSSLRADPLGTMAFFESLENFSGLSVERGFSATSRLPEGNETTYFSLATSMDDWGLLSERDFRYMDAFVAEGGRLVITIFPEAARSLRLRDHEKTDN